MGRVILNCTRFIDISGQEVAECIYDEIISFAIKENLIIVKKDCKIGFIDKYGKQIIACHYQDAEDFYQGLALVEKNEKKGYIDKRGVEYWDDDPDMYYNRGFAKYQIEDYQGAILDYDKALEVNPDDSDIYNNRGNAKAELEDYNGAILDYSKAIELDSNDGVFFWNRGLAYEELNELENAKKDWQKAADLGYVDAINEMKEYSA